MAVGTCVWGEFSLTQFAFLSTRVTVGAVLIRLPLLAELEPVQTITSRAGRGTTTGVELPLVTLATTEPPAE